jgi:hypothetical protein
VADEICSVCGKPTGTGTLLDQFPEPPAPRTSVHRLYLLFESNFSEFPSSESQATPIDPEAWTSFASRYRCYVCQGALEVGVAFEHDHPLGMV